MDYTTFQTVCALVVGYIVKVRSHLPTHCKILWAKYIIIYSIIYPIFRVLWKDIQVPHAYFTRFQVGHANLLCRPTERC